MFRSTNKAAMLLLLFTSALAGNPIGNMCGPNQTDAGDADAAAHTGYSGEPKPGYHLRTYDPTNTLTFPYTRTDGTKLQYNQVTVKDAPKDASPLEVDPADGIYGQGLHVWGAQMQNYHLNGTTKMWDVPSKADCPTINPTGKSAGYPSNYDAANADFVSVMRQTGYLDSAEGVVLRNSDDSKADGYNKLSEGKDYMLLYFGADWCPDCSEFSKRFSQYYNEDIKQNEKVEAVYFGRENTEAESNAYRKTLPFPAARFDKKQELTFRLKDAFKITSIPCVVVIDKNGTVVTKQGVQGIKGEAVTDGQYPLKSRADLFANQAILPGDGNCSIDTEEQRKQLLETNDASIRTMSKEQLITSAGKIAAAGNIPADQIPTDTEALRKWVLDTADKVINETKAEDIEKAYIKLEERENEAQNYHFKVDDFVRVKKAFTSDPETIGGDQNRVPEKSSGINVGKIVAVTAAGGSSAFETAGVVEGSIKVQFKDNTYARRWLLPKHFDNIEKITTEEAYKEGFPIDA